jgi:hypothetical protein
MTSKEISEIRRRISPEKHNITTIRGRYVNQKHETISEFSHTFSLLPDDECEKYLAIFRRTLSGSPGKNLIDIGFSMSQVESGEEHNLLQTLRKTALKDDEAVNKFFDKAAASLTSEGNSLILLISDAYDVPKKSKSEGGDDESDTIFTYIMCAVCPVKEAKPTLTYDASDKTFRARSCDWHVSAPELGFLFPAFDCRKTNIYNALYYVKNPSDNNEEFSDAIFKTELPLPADEQRQIFEELLSETLGDECSYEVVQAIHSEISQKIEEHKTLRIPEPLTVTKRDLAAVLESCGIPEEKVSEFETRCDEKYGAGVDLTPQNLIEPKRLEVRTPDVIVKVNPERGDLVETRIINGVKYVLIRADEDITVNGVAISIHDDEELNENNN